MGLPCGFEMEKKKGPRFLPGFFRGQGEEKKKKKKEKKKKWGGGGGSKKKKIASMNAGGYPGIFLEREKGTNPKTRKKEERGKKGLDTLTIESGIVPSHGGEKKERGKGKLP